MRKKYEIISKIPSYKLFRKYGSPKIFPLNLTVSVSYHCNSRCKTCNVWKKKVNEFSIYEFDKTFESIGNTPYWLTLSGGEPFLNSDIVEICNSAYNNLEPGIINIPTNGILFEKIPEKIEKIVRRCKNSQIIVNLSIDGIGEKHDDIRNVRDNFNKAMKTYEALSNLNYSNFSLGVHTVISKYNVDNIPEIYEFFKDKTNGSFITEIAEQRVELDTTDCDISPSNKDYIEKIDYLSDMIKKEKSSNFSKIKQAFRLEYYSHVKKVIQKKQQVIPCYAGFASAHISPDGEVWACCIDAEPMGNLRDVDYNFEKIWFSDRAFKQREKIKNKECYCTLANAHYTNMLCDFGSMIKVMAKII